MSKKKGHYIFSLIGVNIEEIDKQFGIGFKDTLFTTTNIPKNSTNIDDLETKHTPDVISFLDEAKKKRTCYVSIIDFQTKKQLSNTRQYKCFWDRNYIPDFIQPIGCPVKFVPNKATRCYHSELSKDQYVISEEITNKKAHQLSLRNNSEFTIEHNSYYETDGIFCSFNCLMAYIKADENCRNPLYNRSESLAMQMYIELNDEKPDEILPAPHWRQLEEHGGHLTIEQFRASFNKIEYVNHGVISQKSLGMIYEDKIRLL